MPTKPTALFSNLRTLYLSTQYLLLTSLIIIGAVTLLILLCYHAYVCGSICVSCITGRESAVVKRERKLRWRSLVWKGGVWRQDVEVDEEEEEGEEDDERQGLVMTREVESKEEGGMRHVVVEGTRHGTVEL